MMSKLWCRCSIFVLVLCHFVFPTDMVFGVSYHIVPKEKIIADDSFPCAFHDCGCKTAEQCRSHCCCFPELLKKSIDISSQKAPKHEENMSTNLSYFSDIGCSGSRVVDGVLDKENDRYIPFIVFAVASLDIAGILNISEGIVPLSVLRDPPEKIPIFTY